jgi:uncharacterized membrane protein
MRIDNPIQMNDWEIKKFLRVVVSLQVALWGISAWSTVGLDAPALRYFIGFIYLTFVPGVVILRVLRLHRLGNIRTLLYAIGLSLSTLMLIGLLLNTIGDALGVSQPITAVLIIVSTSVFVLGFSGIAYLRDGEFAEPSRVELSSLFSPSALFLCLLPIVVVVGVYSWDYFQSDHLLMVTIALVAVAVVLIAWGKLIPTRLYPFAVTVISMALLYHTWLVSPLIWGRDIHSEYYAANSVLLASRWDPGALGSTNAMLGIAMLAPEYSLVLGMDLTWVLKIVYPTVDALIPLGLFWIFRKQSDDRIAFLSCFLFMSIGFYDVWLISAKQLTAELFLVFITVLMMDDKLPGFKRAILSIVFGFSLIVTHYGTSYVFMMILALAWLTLAVIKRTTIASQGKSKPQRSGRAQGIISESRTEGDTSRRIVRASFLFLLFAASLAWYEFVTGATTFNDVVRVGNQVVGSTLTDFLNPSVAQGYGALLSQPKSLFGYVLYYTTLAAQFLITIGVLALLVNRKRVGIRLEYMGLAVASFIVMIFSIVLPYFSSALYTPRLYNIALVFLAPLCIVGGLFSMEAVKAVGTAPPTRVHRQRVLKAVSLLLVAIFLFGTGFAAELAHGPPSSIPLGGLRLMQSDDVNDRARFYSDMNVFEQDVRGTEWLHQYGKAGSLIYNDSMAAALTSYGMSTYYFNQRLLTNSTSIPPGAYVCLDYSNIVGGILHDSEQQGLSVTVEIQQIDPLLDTLNLVYSNGGDTIFYA